MIQLSKARDGLCVDEAKHACWSLFRASLVYVRVMLLESYGEKQKDSPTGNRTRVARAVGS